MNLSNCLIWALRNWRWRDGEYLLIRRSRWGWWPHFLLASTAPADCRAYVPAEPNRPHRLPPPLFRGKVRVGD